MNLRLEYNEEIIKRLKAYDISTDFLGSSFFVLHALWKNRIDLLDCMDDSMKERRMVILYRQLERKGLLQPSQEKFYELTQKGRKLTEFLEDQFDKLHLDVEQVEVLQKEDVDMWIKDYIEIFPRGVHSNKILRSNIKDVTKRMDEFTREYGYPKDLILKATKKYISEREEAQDNHTFTINSLYFITKGLGAGRKSELANWCERILAEGDSEEQVNTNFMDAL